MVAAPPPLGSFVGSLFFAVVANIERIELISISPIFNYLPEFRGNT
jgi:hypothetical protein